ncbi:MAG: DUF2145 domain-containing protein [Burkholderiales bacterium]
MRAALVAGLALSLSLTPCWAGSLSYCDGHTEPTAAVQDRLIQVAGIIKDELDRSGQNLAIVSRSGLALQRLDQRYSHAGISLKASDNTPWSVRQLYYACDEQRPRIFDQGMSGFVLGAHDPGEGYVSILLLPDEAALALERTTLNDEQALQLLGAAYSANAYAFSQRYQNCNQWLVELLASAWGPQLTPENSRESAQHWLRSEGYQPSVLKVGWQPLMWVAALLPWLHSDDHPEADLMQAQFQVSMPQSIESFVQARLPDATHMELCYTDQRVVLRRGWQPIAPGCQPQIGDQVISLLN